MNATRPANRACVLTLAGRGAVAVVAVQGPAGIHVADKLFQAANRRALVEQPIDRVLFGHWACQSHREEVVVVRTADSTLEIHCHGGIAAAARITAALAEGGCEIVPWEQWLAEEQQNHIHLEADLALAKATTRRTAALLLQQRNGALQRAIERVETALVNARRNDAAEQLRGLLAHSQLGLHLTNPWQVAIAGKPNVGKSSLINALAGYQRAIVYHEPGTTRDVLSVETAIDGWPVRLTDAAGIRETPDPLEAEGVARARLQLQAADLVLWLFDLSAMNGSKVPLDAVKAEAGAEFASNSLTSQPRVLFVGNKLDLLPGRTPNPTNDFIFISARDRTGLDELLQQISKRLAPTPPTPGDGVPFTERQVSLLSRAMEAISRADDRVALSLIAELLHRHVSGQ
jgi:tRNA modification GTPase